MHPIKNKKIKFLITVDVETYFSNGKLLSFETNIYGRINGKDYGVPKIIEICDNYNVKATFFVDVYEHYLFGLNKIRTLCQNIFNCGHSVQLHAHPNIIPGCVYGLMKSYDFKTQCEIIREGKQLIGDWVGNKPIAFRAGAYGANIDTIRALEENGFLIDSSYFANHKNCNISSKYCNRLFRINNILEIPITVYDLFNICIWKKRSKLDINACSINELEDIIVKIIKLESNNLETVVLFLHSFSFIKWDKLHNNAFVNYKAIDKFNSLLYFLINSYSDSIEFVRIDEIDNIYIEKMKNENLFDYVPRVKSSYLFSRLFRNL